MQKRLLLLLLFGFLSQCLHGTPAEKNTTRLQKTKVTNQSDATINVFFTADDCVNQIKDLQSICPGGQYIDVKPNTSITHYWNWQQHKNPKVVVQKVMDPTNKLFFQSKVQEHLIFSNNKNTNDFGSGQ